MLKHKQIVHLGRLLDMMYKPTELAEEIDVTPDTIYRSYIPAGLPVDRDMHGRLWIHGLAFVDWARKTIALKKSKRKGLPEGQAWCLKCKGPVPLANPVIRPVNHSLELMQSACPICGTTINRARARQRGAR